METKKSTVKRVVHNTGSFSTTNGTFYKHLIEFDNGDKGDYNSKSDTCTKFKEGIEVAYTIEQNGKYNAKIKPIQEEQSGNSGKFGPKANQDLILAQTCIKSSCEYHSERQSSAEEVLSFADSLFAWCKAKSNSI